MTSAQGTFTREELLSGSASGRDCKSEYGKVTLWELIKIKKSSENAIINALRRSISSNSLIKLFHLRMPAIDIDIKLIAWELALHLPVFLYYVLMGETE